MKTDTSEIQACLRRIEALENENRWFKRIGLVVAIVGLAVVGMGQSNPIRTIEASKFVLRDSKGSVRAELGMDSGTRPTLTLRDAKGFPLIAVAGGDEPTIALMRAGNEESATLFVGKGKYGLALYGKSLPLSTGGGVRAGLAVIDGIPGLSFRDERGKERAAFDLIAGEPRIALSRDDGKVLWSAP